MKYGTRVPSFEVAKCCSTTSLPASKNAGLDFNASGSRPGFHSDSVVGVRNPVSVNHRSSLSSASTAPTPSVPMPPRPVNGVAFQPCAGSSTSSRLFTSSRMFSTSLPLVHVESSSEVVSLGVNSTAKSRLPAMKSSNFVASSAPAG